MPIEGSAYWSTCFIVSLFHYQSKLRQSASCQWISRLSMDLRLLFPAPSLLCICINAYSCPFFVHTSGPIEEFVYCTWFIYSCAVLHIYTCACVCITRTHAHTHTERKTDTPWHTLTRVCVCVCVCVYAVTWRGGDRGSQTRSAALAPAWPKADDVRAACNWIMA